MTTTNMDAVTAARAAVQEREATLTAAKTARGRDQIREALIDEAAAEQEVEAAQIELARAVAEAAEASAAATRARTAEFRAAAAEKFPPLNAAVNALVALNHDYLALRGAALDELGHARRRRRAGPRSPRAARRLAQRRRRA